jgi:predicted nucleotidyltransferase component of viral defense system
VGSLTLDEIKKLAIIGLFSDDDLMEVFVLKGGNALDLVYNISPRASLDLDVSLQADLDYGSLDTVRAKIETALKRVFNEKGYEVFDVTLEEQPKTSIDKIPDFWGGYLLFFKIIELDVFRKATARPEDLRRRAEVVGPNNRKRLKVDISKHEYCEPKKAVDIEGYRVYVYTPEMIVFEKLRAICQQTEEYCSQIGKIHRQARARDFFDIYTIIKHFNINVTDPNNLDLLKNIFLAKEVPLKLLTVISEYRSFHRSDFSSVQDTLKPGERIRDFDYYFDYVVTECDDLSKTLGVI